MGSLGAISSSTPPSGANNAPIARARLWLGSASCRAADRRIVRASSSIETPWRAARTWRPRFTAGSRFRIVIVAITQMLAMLAIIVNGRELRPTSERQTANARLTTPRVFQSSAYIGTATRCCVTNLYVVPTLIIRAQIRSVIASADRGDHVDRSQKRHRAWSSRPARIGATSFSSSDRVAGGRAAMSSGSTSASRPDWNALRR